MVKRLLLGLLGLLLVLVAVVAINTWRQGSRQIEVPALAPLDIDKDGAARRLGEAVRLRTISSRDDPALNTDQFQQLQALLQARYPKAHAVMKRELVGDLSLLYTWPGSDPGARPIVVMAHQDVVPVAPGTDKDWTVAPFSGALQDGFVWGRGSWDNKGNLIAQMEALEMLAAAGFQPRRTIHLVAGADEEVGGLRGAKRIAALLKERHVRVEFVIDEGLLITDGILPGLRQPAAIVGVAEKGYMSVVLRLNGKPGHASMPPPPGQSAIGMMSAALKRIDDEQLPAAIRGVAGEMFATVAPEMDGFLRVALSNLWLFGPIVQKQLEAGPSTNALLRTTTALTITQAGNKENVLPGQAEATINFRLLPGDTIAQVTERVRSQVQQVTGGGNFELFVLPGANEATKVSSTDSAAYRLLNRTVREVFPGTLVAPGLYIAGSDSVHFVDISEHVFRFSPIRARPEDLSRFHGTNERISLDNLADLIRFYHRLLSTGAQTL
ncbi:MAG: M20 family peptidase [Rhodoferax sp.]|jgi:carboxypeptidase PM20D1|nr:M20 family peptidase [Rhodoferax sp.]